jgi:hypothetical protein
LLNSLLCTCSVHAPLTCRHESWCLQP